MMTEQALPVQRARAQNWLPIVLVLLFCLQPVLDILSYWQDALEIPFSLSFVPRTLVLAVLAMGGFVLSKRKRVYLITGGVIVLFYAAHLYACYTNGIESLTTDASTFIRVLQLPITTLCLITCLRRDERSFEAMQRGMVLTLLILAVSFAVSTLTGTEPYTYPDRNVGVRGYSFWPNAQSAILSLAAPISIGYSIKKKPDKPLAPIATMVLSMVLLFVHGTRLSFLCMMITSAGMALVVLLVKGVPKKYAVILLALTVLGGCAYRFSPMYTNRRNVTAYTEVKASASERLLALGQVQLDNGNSPVLQQAGAVDTPTGMQAFALKNPLQTSSFADIPADDARSAYLAYGQSLGLLSGCDTEFNFVPDDELTYAQALTLADTVYERYTGEIALPEYTGDTWFDAYVQRAQVYGFLPEGMSDPEDFITRAQAAKLLYQMLPQAQYPQTLTVTQTFENEQNSAEALALCRAGVLDDEAFRADEIITRGEFAVYLVRAVQPSMRLNGAGTAIAVQPYEPDLSGLSQELKTDALYYPLYNYFCKGLVERFGVHAVLEAYSYTTETETIINERDWKLQYCYLLMDESTPVSRLLGLEVTRMLYKGTSYDVENDFHGIYLLYGWVGLGLMVLFLGYFLVLIVLALLKNAKRYFTLEAGAFGIALITCLVHAYFTCGVLRRANTLFYLAALLAGVYYLTKVKAYPDEKEGS